MTGSLHRPDRIPGWRWSCPVFVIVSPSHDDVHQLRMTNPPGNAVTLAPVSC
jgi:hypothetical protein